MHASPDPEQFQPRAGSSVHRALQGLQSVDLAFGVTIVYDLVWEFALQQGYTNAGLVAPVEAIARQQRVSHPTGIFYGSGCFTLTERLACCEVISSPTCARPHAEMLHGRSLGHVAQLHGVPRLEVQRLVRVQEAVASLCKVPVTGHVRAQLEVKLRHILKRIDDNKCPPAA